MSKVLLLEDEEKSLDGIIRRAQQSLRFEVTYATNVQSAAEVLQSSRYDLVLVDMRVPLSEDQCPVVEGGRIFLQAAIDAETANGRELPPFIVISLQSNLIETGSFANHPNCFGVFGKFDVLGIKAAIQAALL